MKKIMYGAFIIILIGVLGLIITINTSGKKLFSFNTVEVHEKKEFDAEDIKNILIKSSSVDVNVIPTDGDKVIAELKGKASKNNKDTYKLEIDEDHDTLEINVDRKEKFEISIFNFTSVDLNVEVPQKVYDSLEINTSSGDINTEDLEAKNLSIEANSGNIEALGGKIETTLMIETSSGDITANDFTANAIEVSANSGNIEVNDNQAEKITLETSSGDIECFDQTANELKTEAASGNIEIDGKEVTGNINAESSSGDIELEFTTVSSIEVDYKSSSGDGKVKIEGMEFKENSEHRIIGEIGNAEHNITIRTSSGNFKLK
ncbi:DUF4097 family beta strand repeat-containing protein [Ferdinandcohnia quinoae]|uniref:DUF4097 domain-containing protein n=1 Tax=Fredinandcohnia quinoae TaxID=2918902 RepID=A0AAW5EDK8_9BACI|nr:DUF4097 family beta strand repeat-containing protein [Fredinandcohnia sp. SECRCQ15]MCH1627536.1 DUF4097 domain-containing protein [Fredinandcohnia sp. SECRCQ15]